MVEINRDILNPNNDPMLATILDSLENDIAGRLEHIDDIQKTDQSGNIATMVQLLPGITSKSVHKLANLRRLVAFQPMKGPVSQVHVLRSIKKEDQLSLQLSKMVVAAKVFLYKARWPLEIAQDAQAMQEFDTESEIMAAFAQEITAEIENGVLKDIRETAHIEYLNTDNVDVGISKGDLIIQKISSEAENIGRRSNRYTANWVVVNQEIYNFLKNSTSTRFVDMGTQGSKETLRYVGEIDSKIAVFVDCLDSPDNQVLLGYRGENETDAGYFYCPYIYLNCGDSVIDPESFNPVIVFSTRLGTFSQDAEKYYTVIRVNLE